jgi:pentapeptide repeat protein
VPDYPSGQDLSGHDLTGADLRHANLTGHDLSGANLSGADLRGANLAGVNLSEANLTGANFSGANLIGANVTGATSRDTLWPEGFNPEPVSGTDTLGPTFTVMVEGTVYAWETNTISVAEIRSLGGLPGDRPVVQMELAGGEDYGPVAERPLKEDESHELVQLKPGRGVVKHVEFKRG